MIRVLDSLESLERCRDDWNDLLKKSGSDTIFLTWEWIYSWCRHFLGENADLFVLLAVRENRLIGIAPWCIRTVRYGPFRTRRIQFLGTPEMGSDYLDVVAAGGREEEVASSIYDFLIRMEPKTWDCFHFSDVCSKSPFFYNFINHFKSDGKYLEVREDSYCPIVDLPESREGFLSSLRPHRRRQYFRHLRILEKMNGIKYVTAVDSRNSGALEEFCRFYERTWGKSPDHQFPFLETFLSLADGKNWVEIDFMYSKGAMIAAILHFVYHGKKYSYLTAIDKTYDRRISIGNVLIGLCLQKTIEKDIAVYDFLKGGEPYKFHWANSGERMLKIDYYRKKLVPIAQYACESVKNFGKIVLR